MAMTAEQKRELTMLKNKQDKGALNERQTARLGLLQSWAKAKDVKPAGDDMDKFKPGRVVTNKSDGRKAVVAYRPTSNKVMVYPKGGGKEEYRHMDECVGSKEAKARTGDETFRVFDSGEVVDVSNEVAPVGDDQDHPDPAVQAKVDKYRATALAQGFKPENVEASIKQLIGEGRFKATSKVSDADDLAGVRRRYDELKGRNREDLFRIYSRSHRVNSAEKAPKGDLIAGIMEAEFGAKKYEAAFAKDAAAFKPGDKVWANPIGRSGGTVKGTVARINASGQVVIESGGREHEFHPSNVRASDVRPVGDAIKAGSKEEREMLKQKCGSCGLSIYKAKNGKWAHRGTSQEHCGGMFSGAKLVNGKQQYEYARPDVAVRPVGDAQQSINLKTASTEKLREMLQRYRDMTRKYGTGAGGTVGAVVEAINNELKMRQSR